MRNLNNYLIILFLIFSCSFFVHYDDEYEKLKGQVKTVEESTYSIIESNGKVEKSRLTSKIVMAYDKDGNEAGRKIYDTNGDLKEVIACLYNEQNKLKEETGINAQGEMTTRTTYKYNDKGMMVEENLWTLIYANPIATTTYSYDDEGRMKESIAWYSYKKDKVMWRYVYEYNAQGQKVMQKTFKEDGSLERKYVYEYNDKGYQSKEEVTGDVILGSTYIFKYQYDKKGNWIKRIEIFEGEPSGITERIINYYE